MDDLGLVEAVDRLGESVVVAVADAADGGLDAGLGQALGVADAERIGQIQPVVATPHTGGVHGYRKTEIGTLYAA